MSGFPASGKTTRANQLAEYFRANTQMTVHVINEESLLIQRSQGYKGPNQFSVKSQQKKRVFSFFLL